MLDNILRRGDVLNLIKEIGSNNRYNKKEKMDSINYLQFVNVEQPLFILVDALFKYKVIIDDIYLLDDYIEQLDLLFRKLSNFYDIRIGINRLIAKFVAIKLGYKDKIEENRRKILSYVYDRYIANGYLFHSVSDVYVEDIKINGFTPQKYNNLYPEFNEVKNILGNDIMGDLNEFEVSFTDNFLMAYYYAVNSPMYFYKILCDNYLITKKEDKEAYFKNDYVACFKNLNKVIYKLDLGEAKAKKVRYICNKEWNLLNRSDSCPTVMVVKRSLLLKDDIREYEEILNNTEDDLGDLVGKIIDSRFNNVKCSKKINSADIEFISLFGYKDVERQDSILESDDIIDGDKDVEFVDDYGKVSLLLLIGSMLITFGVILSIIMMSR